MRLFNFILLLVLSVNVSWAYVYDADLHLSNHKIVGFEQQNQRYDDTPNLYCNGRHCAHTSLRKKTQNGSFFAFEVGFVATKSAEAAADAALAAGRQSGAAAELIVGNRIFTGISREVIPESKILTGILAGEISWTYMDTSPTSSQTEP